MAGRRGGEQPQAHHRLPESQHHHLQNPWLLEGRLGQCRGQTRDEKSRQKDDINLKV